jgi:hypothetical protein
METGFLGRLLKLINTRLDYLSLCLACRSRKLLAFSAPQLPFLFYDDSGFLIRWLSN